jgi:hypothetical protein
VRYAIVVAQVTIVRRVRIVVDLSLAEYEALSAASRRTGKTEGEIIGEALRCYVPGRP